MSADQGAVSGLQSLLGGVKGLDSGGADQSQGPKEFQDLLKKMDANGDGAIDKSEFKGLDELFALLDKNKDGVIDEKDFAENGQSDCGPGQGGVVGQPGGGGQPQGADSNAMDQGGEDKSALPDVIGKMDANKDGAVSQKEFQGDREVFGALDGNQDGVLTGADFAKSA